jgi:L-amino acid N-acyltransferase YncA
MFGSAPALPGRSRDSVERDGCGSKRGVVMPRWSRMMASVAYPAEFERTIALSDGTTIRLRPIRPDDAERLIELYARLSRASAYQRFFSAMQRLPPDWARYLANVDYDRRLALVAEHGASAGPIIVAVGRYEPTDYPGTVEVAFAVEDAWQGRGLGSVLFREVLRAATARGFRRFVAYVLGDNRRMLDMIRRFGRVEESAFDSGVVELRFTAR